MTNQKLILSRFRMLGAFFAYLVFSVLLGVLFLSSKAQAGTPTAWQQPDRPTCGWVDTASLRCNASDQGSGPYGGVYADYYLDPQATLDAGHPVFRASSGSLSLNDATNAFGYVHILQGDFRTAIISDSRTSEAGGYKQDPVTKDEVIVNSSPTPDKLDGNIVCGMTYLKTGCAYGFTKGGTVQITNMSQANLDKANEIITKATQKYKDTKQAEDSCTNDAGAIGFVICPLIQTTNSAINGLTGADGTSKGFLVELLTIKPLEANGGIYNAWVAIRNIALGLYIVVFALIIFGNGVGYDPYTIKRALPRLAVGALLTFGSYFIMQTLVDLSNIIGNAIPAFISQVTQNANVANYALTFNFAQGAIYLILWLILVFVALGALLIGIAGLIMRVVIIYGLVLLAPLAFLAWVLPNTESMFKKWWSNLIKVLMMFPIVTGMLSIAILFQSAILGTSTNTGIGTGSAVSSTATQIAAAVAPLIAIILIPKTFKWGGDLFIAAAGYVAGKASGAGKAIEGIPGKAGRAAAGSTAKGILSSEKMQDVAASLASRKGTKVLGGAALQRRTQAAKTQRLKAGEDLVQNMNGGQIARVARKGNFQERVAATRELMKRGDYDGITNLLSEGGGVANSTRYALNSYRSDGKSSGAGFIQYDDKGGIDIQKTREKIRNTSPEMLASDLGDKAFADLAGEGKLLGQDVGKGLIDPQLRDLGASQALYGKLSGEKKRFVTPTFNTSGGSSSGGSTVPAPGTGTAPPAGVSSGGSGPGGGSPAGRPGSPVRPMGYTAPDSGTSSGSSSSPSGGTPTGPAPTPSYSSSTSGSTSSASPSGGTPLNPGTTTQIINNNSVSQVFQQSGTIRTQIAASGDMGGYGDLMRKMDGIDAKLASGRVDSFTLKKDLKSLRMARDSAPESMHGQIDEYMRSAERAAGLPEKAGDHEDVDLGTP